MSSDIDNLKNKIIYRSQYRGSKEMDILLSTFVKDVINLFNEDDLKNLLNLLNIDDENLYKFNQGIKTEVKINQNRVTDLFKKYIYKK